MTSQEEARNSMLEDERKQLINDTIAQTMQELMSQGRLRMESETPKKTQEKFKRSRHPTTSDKGKSIRIPHVADSEITIYERAVPSEPVKHNSSSSEDDQINTSDEIGIIEESRVPCEDDSNLLPVPNYVLMVNLGRDSIESRFTGSPVWRMDREETRQQQAQMQVTPEQRAEMIIKEAKLHKAQVYEVPGKDKVGVTNQFAKQFLHTLMVDEQYLCVGAHIDSATRQKFENGEYVDFARLLPRDKVNQEEDHRLQWVTKNGMTYLTPPESSTSISSFGIWEQAFRVFSDIYTRKYPGRAAELI